jgi:chaperonin GroES
LGERVLVRRAVADSKTPGGILIPDTAKEKPQIGEVLAAGPGHYEVGVYVPNPLIAGDRVMLGKWAGVEVTIDGEELLIVKASEVLGKIV